MTIHKVLSARLAQMLDRRCFLLFLALLALLVFTPFLVDSYRGRALVGLLNVFNLVTAVEVFAPHCRAHGFT